MSVRSRYRGRAAAWPVLFAVLIGCTTGATAVLGQIDSTGERTPTVSRLPLSPFGEPFPFTGYRHQVEFDTASGNVRLYESVFGVPYGQPQTMSLEDFIAARQREQERAMWEKRAADYKLGDAPSVDNRDMIEKIIGNSTTFEIPIPQNPIFSIFGAPTVSVSVSASVVLSAGWQIDNNNLTSINALSSTQSAPFFQQNIQVSASAKVGDKLKLNADFDNGRSFDFDNNLKIAFGGGPGSDDDIIQSVEAGTVQLTTPSTLIGGSQALFGVKSSFKFGALNLTAIAAQKRGERKFVTVQGGSVKTTVTLKPYDYAQNHFWLDTVYKRFWDEYYASPTPSATREMDQYTVTDLEVYEQVKDASIPGQIQAVAYADLESVGPNERYSSAKRNPDTIRSGVTQLGAFKKMEAGVGYDFDRLLGTVTIRSLQQDKAYAVAYKTSGNRAYGELTNVRGDTGRVVLKLIYVNNLQPTFTTLWNRQMKNIYQLLGIRNVDLQNSSIRISYGIPPSDTSEVLKIQGNPRLVTILGVDRFNSSNEAKSDGEFDIRQPYFFDPAKGEIIFPTAEPFRKGIENVLGADAGPYVIDAIYTQTKEAARRDQTASRYTISGEIAGTGGNKISLGSPFGIQPASIRVIANGQPLKENEDYRVDPVFGEVTLISARANNSTGNIVVEYEQNDFLTTAVKTLLGLRADYDLMNKRYWKSKIGMTFARYQQTTQTEKVQIYSGDEPTTNVMIGFDGSLEHKAGWLTKAIDALPLIDTKEMSLLSVQGEWAMVIPNPNIKESLVASDLGKGAAYIDDFESGAKRQIQLSTSYTYWHPASAPSDLSLGSSDSGRTAKRSEYYWYNTPFATTETREIWPNRDVATGAQKTTVLDLIYNPARRGMYNWNFDYERGGISPDSVWGGMMRSLSFYTTNLDEENIDYIEITMKVDGPLDPRTKLYLDLGQISEDVIPNQKLNTEDGITAKNPQRDDILNDGEDVGLDGLNDAQERDSLDPNDPDPSRDDFRRPDGTSENPADYPQINGLENNVGPERGPYPDSEDLNGNLDVDLDNSYFSYEINLDPNPISNTQIVGGGDNKNGWRQYRIPIRTGYRTVGNPSFANVQFARIWFKGPVPVHVRVAEMNLVGSDWRNLNAAYGDTVRDPKLEVAFVSSVDNSGPPDFYTVPPGVRPELDLINNVEKNEQSLVVRACDLNRGESRGAVRVRPRAFDMFNYKEMKFFLHGGGDMDDQPTPGQEPKVIAFMRFGWDSLNYYEYRVPLLRGWNEYTVNFGDLAAIKRLPFDAAGYNVPGQPGNKFVLKGIPSLTRVQFIAFGIINNAYPGSLCTTMWVDELRATSAEDANDWAATVAANAKLADLGTINYNAKRVNPNFHQLEERFGNRVESTNWAFNSDFRLEKFLPGSFKGSSLPVVFKHVERLEKPRYVAESDVEVEAAVRQIGERQNITPDSARILADSLRNATETLVVQDGFAMPNIKLSFPGDGWVVKDILNRLTFGYSYDQQRERSPIIAQKFSWNWNFQGNYSVDIPAKYDLQPFGFLAGVPVLNFWKDFKINFLPSQFSMKTALTRTRTTEQLRNVLDPSPVIRDFFATRSAAFNWRVTEGGLLNVSTDYTVDTRSSLTHLETDLLGTQRTGGEIAKELFLKEGRLFNFGLDQDLTQKFTFSTRPRIPFIPNADQYVTPSARYNVTYNWHDDLTQTNAGRQGGFTKTSRWNSTATLDLNFRMSAIGNAIFGDDRAADSAGVLATILRYLIKIPLLDYQTVRFGFNQSNSTINPGVVGSTGFSNLWGRSLLFRSESPTFGPGAAYQLGLISDPHGTLNLHLSPKFPFVAGDTKAGIRAPNIYVPETYTQNNSLTASTDRDLWPGARLTLNWNVDWGYNKNYFISTDANGIVDTIRNPLLTGKVARSYLSLPEFFGFNAFDNDIEGVAAAYAKEIKENFDPRPTEDSALTVYNRKVTAMVARVFEQKLEALNWLPGEIGRYLPRVNWRFTWNGLEKLPFFSGWAQMVSLRHEYKGQFTRNYRLTGDEQTPESQTVSRGFSPLIQVSVTGKPDVWNGTMTGSISYRSTSDFSLLTSDRSEISKELKSELEAQFSYQKRGLSLPLFGLNLKNDIEFAANFTLGRNNKKRFNLTDFRPEGNNDGYTRISFRPSIRYTLSNTVQASGFVSYEATIPDDEGSRDIRRSTTRIGIDLRIGISGGR